MKSMRRIISIGLTALLLVALSVPMGLTVYGKMAPVSVLGNGVEVNESTPDVKSNTEFVNEAEYTIRNNYGNEVIKIDSIEITGDDKADFAITQTPAAELKPEGEIGSTASLIIQCNAADYKKSNATVTLTVSYDDDGKLDGYSFSFPIQGIKLYSGGTGTKAKPYRISTADDLKLLSDLVNNGTSYGIGYFEMTDDIALNSDTSNYENWGLTPPENIWTPIGCDGEFPFTGNFNGNNHEVSGIYTIANDANGLFGIGVGCTIENLGIVESMITSASRYTGAVIGGIGGLEGSAAVLKNCYNKGIVSGGMSVGGVAGTAVAEEGEVLVSDCYNEGKVSSFGTKAKKGTAAAGGIAGSLISSEGDAILQNCRNLGEVSGSGCVGGIIGLASADDGDSHAIVSGCKNTGALSLRLHKGTAEENIGAGWLGGIVGENARGLIINCGSTGKISADAEFAESLYIGGIAGVAVKGMKCILNNYSRSDIDVAFSTGDEIYTGGIVGYVVEDNVENNYYAGNIQMNVIDVEKQYVGYAFGRTRPDEATIIKNYYDISQTDIGGDGEPGMTEGVAPAAMKLGSGDDALLTKLNNGIASVGAIITEKGYTTTSAIMASKGYTGVTPSAWFIGDSGYPQFDKASSSGGGGSGPKEKPALQQTDIKVNGDPIGGTSTNGTEGGRTFTTVTLDEKALKEKLKQLGSKPTVTIPVNNGSDIVRGELSGQMVKDMEEKEAILEIKTGSVQYVLPAAQINIGAISAEAGEQVTLSDIKVQIQIYRPTKETVKVIEDAAKKGPFALVVPPVEFDIKCTYGTKTVDVSRFNSYVERTVAIPDGVDPAKITTGVVLGSDGTVHHVPTKITVIGGKYYAVINSLTNSAYTVVWNPVEFADASNHWAKAAINDMGSRMVIGGVGNGKFEPNRDITRAEFAAIIVRALGLAPGEGDNNFTDVSDNAWYAGYVKTAVSYGVITGVSDTSFKPNSKITREQAMSMVARAMKLTKIASDPNDTEIQSSLSAYGDIAGVSGYAKQSVAECLKAGVVSGRTGKTIAPKENMTRAEVAAVIQRLLQKSDLI